MSQINISIHALRVEGDCDGEGDKLVTVTISIHALRVEGDGVGGTDELTILDFYPRPPGGGRPVTCVERAHNVEISIHALRVEGDNSALQPQCTFTVFLSTPSGWRATWGLFCYLKLRVFLLDRIHI